MKCYAVIDTNVLVSALMSKSDDSATVKVMDALLRGRIIPLYHEDIMLEYEDVLHREKFHFSEDRIQMILSSIRTYGVEVFPQPTGEVFTDKDDIIFYEVVMEKREDGA